MRSSGGCEIVAAARYRPVFVGVEVGCWDPGVGGWYAARCEGEGRVLCRVGRRRDRWYFGIIRGGSQVGRGWWQSCSVAVGRGFVEMPQLLVHLVVRVAAGR